MKAVYLAREECYVYLYISNENATLVDVYFDDVVMTHKRSRLIQGSEYYPYGMQTANSCLPAALTANCNRRLEIHLAESGLPERQAGMRESTPENNFLAERNKYITG